MSEQPALEITRSFRWGLLLLAGRGSRALPALSKEPVAAGAESVAVRVRREQDVAVTAYLATPEPGVASSWSTISVPSGVLTLGDAESVVSFGVTPGHWRVHVRALPEQVTFWLSQPSL